MRSRVSVLLAMALIVGCGAGDGLDRRYPVRGAVTYMGQPLKSGRITFDPVATGGSARVATGTIRDGDYSLSTLGGDDGALPGQYRVGIVAQAADDAAVQKITEGGAARQSDAFKVARKARNLISTKYMSSETSGLFGEVKAESNRIDFKLVD